MARSFGVGWQTVMRAVDDVAAETFAAQGTYTIQTRDCRVVGVDEEVMNPAGPGRRRRYVAVIVDLHRGVPIDIVEGAPMRSRPAGWRSRPRPGAMR